MDSLFFFYCFVIGISATLGLGPMFMLVVNQTVARGLSYGLAVAVGAALADGIYFFLGFVGALQILESHPTVLLGGEVIGGLVLIGIGAYMLRQPAPSTTQDESVQAGKRTTFLVAVKAFLLTITNPFVLLYFLFIMVHLMPENGALGFGSMLVGSILGACGAFISLATVAWGAKIVGRSVEGKWLDIVTRCTSVLFIGIGSYFLVDTAIQYFWL